MKLKIKVKRFCNVPIPKFIDKGEWADLRSRKSIMFSAPQAGTLKYHTIDGEKEGHRDVTFDYQMIPLGIAMKIPKGFEAVIAPRSSTFKNHKLIQANSIGIVDSSYCGNDDEWLFPAIAFSDTTVMINDRVCQFRIQLSQKATVWQKIKWLLSSGVEIIEVNSLQSENRGGFGSTGK